MTTRNNSNARDYSGTKISKERGRSGWGGEIAVCISNTKIICQEYFNKREAVSLRSVCLLNTSVSTEKLLLVVCRVGCD
jgi:hypothetical protein